MNIEKLPCYVCSEIGYFVKDCLDRKGRKVPQKQNSKTANVVTIGEAGNRTVGYKNLLSMFSIF
jgi:hypothetical protein